MNKIKRLLNAYAKFIAIPWKDDIAPPQRVIFCIYHEADELRLRANIDEFEIATRQENHDWLSFDLTDTFAAWMSSQKYAKSYFKKPDLLPTLIPKYLSYIHDEFEKFLTQKGADKNTVVAVQGVGSLFGLLRVAEVVEKIAPLATGRLLVFFPGSYENNNYRLLDGYDGWNYLAIPISAD